MELESFIWLGVS